MKLNLGCGNDYREGYVNVDKVAGVADVLHDLDRFPYPWDDDSIDEVLMHHVLEHLTDIEMVLDEIWRILKAGGKLLIWVPHFSHFQALTHPQHKHAFHYNTFAFCTAGSGEKYTDRLWSIDEARLDFGNRLLDFVFNRCKYRYTSTALAYLFPAKNIRFTLIKLPKK